MLATMSVYAVGLQYYVLSALRCRSSSDAVLRNIFRKMQWMIELFTGQLQLHL